MSDWLNKLKDPSRDPYERRYRLFALSGILQIAVWLLIISIVDFQVMRLIVYLITLVHYVPTMIITLNSGNIQRGASASAFVLIFILTPFVFFNDGGVGAGVFNYAIMAMIFVMMTMYGRLRNVMVVSDLVVITLSFIISWFRPEWVREVDQSTAYLNACVSLLVSCMMAFFAIMFQHYMFRQERALLEARQSEIEDLNRARVKEQYGDEAEQGLGSYGYKQKKRVLIATDSAADLPKEWIEAYGICVVNHKIITETGTFYDGTEINGDELMFYMRNEAHDAHSEVPDETVLEPFFAQCLKEADQVIMITVAKDSSPVYGHALIAARRFEQVSVVDSGSMSAGAGMLVLYAAKTARDDMGARELVARLERVKRRITARFVLDNTRYLLRGGRMSPLLSGVFDAFLFHVTINMTDEKMKFSAAWGSRYRRKFVRSVFRRTRNIDTSLVFITYAGVTEENLARVREEMDRYIRFDRVVMMPTSSAVAVNVGPGTFGFMFHVFADGEDRSNRMFDFLTEERTEE